MRKFYALLLAVVVLAASLLTTSCNWFSDDHLCDECGKCNRTDCSKEGHAEKCICSSIKGELPVYGELAEGEGFYLSIFGDPAQQTVEAYQMVKDLGCNWVYLDPWSGTGLDSAGLIKALECCEAVGLNALIMLSNAHGDTEEELVSLLEDSTVDYTQYPAFKGVYAYDEPLVADMDWIKQDMEKWQDSKYKDYIYLVNMMRSASDAPTTEEYLQQYWDIVLSNNNDNILIYDYYPLYARVGDKVMPYIRTNILDCLEQYAKLAKEHNCDFYIYLQTYCEKDGTARDLVSVNDARFQVALNLAYGVEGFACFTYLSMSQFGDSMITPDGTKLPKYYYIQEVFAELKEFENVYFSFDWVGTITKLGPNRGTDRGYGEQAEEHILMLTESLESHDRINSISTEYDLIIGTFKDKDGYDGFLITSYTDPYYMKDNNIEIDFNNASRALVYLNGKLITNDEEGTSYLLEDGVLKYDLEAGDYLFVVPVK